MSELTGNWFTPAELIERPYYEAVASNHVRTQYPNISESECRAVIDKAVDVMAIGYFGVALEAIPGLEAEVTVGDISIRILAGEREKQKISQN